MNEIAQSFDQASPGYREREQSKIAAEQLLREKLGGEIPIEYGFIIPEEYDTQGNSINADIVWARFLAPEGEENILPVEAKLYIPKNIHDLPDRELVMFMPGYPGGAAGRFESTYASAVLAEGKIFCVTRRNSKPLDVSGKEVAKIYNSTQRLHDAEQDGQKYLGPDLRRPYTWQDLITEGIPSLTALGKCVDKIKLIGNSFGPTCLYYAVDYIRQHDPEIAKKITHLISLAGYLVGEQEGQLWHSSGMSVDKLEEEEAKAMKEDRVNFDIEKYSESLIKLAAQMSNIQIPDHIRQILVCAKNDPLITLPVKFEIAQEDGRKMVRPIEFPGRTQRVLLIDDRTSHKKPHTLSELTPEVLIRLLNFRQGRGTHFVEVGGKV
ncbi:MAG: hypothetical protein AB1352_04415 [Patescibacteria group bacterium]